MNTDPVRILAAAILADDAAFDAEESPTVEIPAVEIEQALADARAALTPAGE